jgi:ankyrin repeat protein
MTSEFDELYKYIKRGRIDIILDFLAQGGDPNLRNGWTLLMVAAHFGNTPILTLLLDHGAQIDAEGGTEGLTPLAMAASQGKRKCVTILLERGANADVRPHGLSLDTYVQYCGGPYPQVDKLLAAYPSS